MGEFDAVEQSVDEVGRAPLVLAVSGLPGAGCTTLAAALTSRFGVVALDESSAGAGSDGVREAKQAPDLLVRVIGAQARARDHAIIDGADVPVIVVAGKADVRTDPRELADAAAADLRRPVVPVSALLAGARLTAADVAVLGRWQRSGVTVPTAAAAFLAGEGGRDRARMMALLGRAGLRETLDRMATHPTSSAADLTGMLRARSGIDALIAPITAATGQIVAGRRARSLSHARLLAARGPDRAAAEQRLIVESVR